MKRKPKRIRREDWDAVDSPPLTPRTLTRMRPAEKTVPQIVKAYRRTRGPQKAPTKIPVSIRLSRDVVSFFRARGSGWQRRIDDVLRDYVKGR